MKIFDDLRYCARDKPAVTQDATVKTQCARVDSTEGKSWKQYNEAHFEIEIRSKNTSSYIKSVFGFKVRLHLQY